MGEQLILLAEGGWHGVDIANATSGIFKEIYDMLPALLPALVGWLGFRKAWSFFRGAVKGA